MTGQDRLDVDRIEAGLKTTVVGSRVLVFNSTSSTNDIAWEYARGRNNSGLCVFAEKQHAGRGRRGNKWHSLPGESILCSVVLLESDCQGDLLTLATGVACAESIARFVPAAVMIKWPNDIVVGGHKIAGILLESRAAEKGNDYVIGIGINCHQGRSFFDEYDLLMPATSIDEAAGARVNRNNLAIDLLNALDVWLRQARENESLVMERWRQMSTLLGEHVKIEHDQKRFSGYCVGVDPGRGLILQLDGGGVRMFAAGQTTIVKSGGGLRK
jgi:BirA family biotin operon repressor/biotin-[acetyl-CoA-carboxylase] ligase